MTTYEIESIIRNGNEYCFSGGGGSGMKVYKVCYLAVGGGGGGSWMNGGGGGEVIVGSELGPLNCIDISIGCGGIGCNSFYGGYGCPTTLTGDLEITARGGQGGQYMYGSSNRGGGSGSGCCGGTNCYNSTYGNATGGGGGGSTSIGGNGDSCNAGQGGYGLCGYGGGGGGGTGYKTLGNGRDGGGDGGKQTNGCNATNCGGGGGGGGVASSCCYGGKGACGIVKICYKCDGSRGITTATGGTVTTEGDYTVHTFTSDGTFCITG